MEEDADSLIKAAVHVFLDRRASGNPITLREYVEELEKSGSLSRKEALAVADAITRANEKWKFLVTLPNF